MLKTHTMVKTRKLDRPLRRDVKLLGSLLGEALSEQEGPELLELEERVRRLAIRRRRGPKAEREKATQELTELLRSLPLDKAEPVVRAFAAYFQLANLAEQNHRIRRARTHAIEDEAPQRGSFGDVLAQAKRADIPAERVRQALRQLEVTLAFTAHPTQATRRTVLEKLYRIAQVLEDRDRTGVLTPAEKEQALRTLREEITVLWQTDEIRRERPSVGDEVKTVLYYVEEVLWDLLPEVSTALQRAFERVYGEPLGFDPSPVRLHSWVGGDMDGNPRVTPDIFEDAMRAHMARGLRRLLSEVRELGGVLSQSDRHVAPPPALVESIARDAQTMPGEARMEGPRTEGEPWRRKLRFIEARLLSTLHHVEEERSLARPGALAVVGGVDGGRYHTAGDLAADLASVADTLEVAGGPDSGVRRVRAVLERVRTRGFHLVELELRVPADDARSAARFLRDASAPTEGGSRLLASLRKLAEAQRDGGPRACQTLILSMAHTADDVLAALECARASGLWDTGRGCATVDVVPLFETLDALTSAPEIIDALLSHPVYRRQVDARGVQEVMVGYSDSGKEVGLLAASAALLEAQTRLVEVGRTRGIQLRIFHGRGESVARGGGPAQQAILALPPGSVAGRYKATEQGEAMDHKYARPQLAMRTLELIIGGALLHTLDAQPKPKEDLGAFRRDFAELAEVGRKAYRAFVWEEPRFVEFFAAVTPLAEVSELPIGSRPSKRRSGGLEALRAIPWVFAWTQNRTILPGWFGVGSALEAFARKPGGLDRLRRMYAEWPHFRAVMDNVEMVLAKSDLKIAERYVELAPPELRPLWDRVAEEHGRAREWVKQVNGSHRLLDGNPSLQRSIALRNPYVDPMSFLQVELLRRKRSGCAECDRPLLLTLSGIASGLRNTG